MAIVFKNPPVDHIIDAEPTARRVSYGRFMSKGYTTPLAVDTENPWVFTHFMVRGAGDVCVYGTDHKLFLLPDCQPGFFYPAVGVAFDSVLTTATGIYVFGGV